MKPLINFLLAIRRSEIVDYRQRIAADDYKRTRGERLLRSNHKWHKIGFNEPTSGGKRWVLFSVYPETKAELRWIIDTFEAVILGAWNENGTQFGTQWEHTVDMQLRDVDIPAVTERVWIPPLTEEGQGEWVVNELEPARTEEHLVDVGPTVVVGTPEFPIETTKLEAFMPEIDGETQSLSSINVLLGQRPRMGL